MVYPGHTDLGRAFLLGSIGQMSPNTCQAVSADQNTLTKKWILILIISTIVAKMTSACLVRSRHSF